MATWKGKAIGAGLGWFLMGPLGAIIGAVIGHGYDEKANRRAALEGHGGPGSDPWAGQTHAYQQAQRARPRQTYDRVRDLSNDDRQLIFVTNLATLLVSVAMADGVFRPEEERSILSFFKRNGFAGGDLDLIKRIVKEVARQKPDLAAVCSEFSRIAKRQDRLLLLRTLYMVAMSDREFHPEERRVIDAIAKHLSISESEKRSIASEFVSDEDRYYQVLGLSEGATDEEIKKAYHEQAGKYHPDRVSHLGKEFIQLANQRFQAINEAYHALRDARRHDD
ncbi:MAG TPA: TerB family tellurite resistance protein [bacterium]|nr:TerB family tellurite resistance protein [bacterium]